MMRTTTTTMLVSMLIIIMTIVSGGFVQQHGMVHLRRPPPLSIRVKHTTFGGSTNPSQWTGNNRDPWTEAATTTTNGTDAIMNVTTQYETCPYSMTFPMYRIPLTRIKNEKPNSSVVGQWLAGLVFPVNRRTIQNLYPDLSSCHVEWSTEILPLAIFDQLWQAVRDQPTHGRPTILVFPAATTSSRTGGSSTTSSSISTFQVLYNFMEIYSWTIGLSENPCQMPPDDAPPPCIVECVATPVPHVILRSPLPSQPPPSSSKTTTTVSSSSSSSTTTTATTPTTASSSSPKIPVVVDAATGCDTVTTHEIITKRTQAWVQRILVERGICPFTKSIHTSGQGLKDLGIPVARIDYRTSFATTGIALLADSVRALKEFQQAGPQQVSSVLLAAPHFDSYRTYWSGPYFAILQSIITATQTEKELGVVCFHPQYRTPDGRTWPGFGQMHSVPRLLQWDDHPHRTWEEAAAGGAWQRRTPHATLNILRADQLATAEVRRNSERLYPINIAKLIDGIGVESLQQNLDRERRMM